MYEDFCINYLGTTGLVHGVNFDREGRWDTVISMDKINPVHHYGVPSIFLFSAIMKDFFLQNIN